MQETDSVFRNVVSVWVSANSKPAHTPYGLYEPTNPVHVGNAGVQEMGRMLDAYRALRDAEGGSPAARAAARFLLGGCKQGDAAALLDSLSEEFHTV